MFLVAGVPGLNSAPGELAPMTLLVGEGHLADRFDAGLNGVARSHVDGAEHAHFQIGRWISHDLLSLNFFFLAPPAFFTARHFSIAAAEARRERAQQRIALWCCRAKTPSAGKNSDAPMR